MSVKRRRLAVDKCVSAGSSERQSPEKRKNKIIEDATKSAFGTQASPTSFTSCTPLPNFRAASDCYASLSTAAKTISACSRGAGTSDVLLIKGDPRRVDSCVSSLTNCASTNNDTRMRAPVRSSTPGGNIYHPSQAHTPRNNNSCYGGLRHPETALFQLPCSPALGALTPPHLPAASGHLSAGIVKAKSQLNCEGQAAFNTVCPSSPERGECLDGENADEGRIVPPHLPSRTSEAAMDAPCQVLMSSVSICLPASPAAQQNSVSALHLSSRQACHAAPTPSFSHNMEAGHAPYAKSEANQQCENVIVTPHEVTVSQARQCDNSQNTCLPTVPTAPAPSPTLHPHTSLPHGQLDSKAFGDGRNHTALSHRHLLTLAASDMDHLCTRLGHLSTRRAPSAPPPNSNHVHVLVEHAPAVRALSCSPPRLMHSSSHRSDQEAGTQWVPVSSASSVCCTGAGGLELTERSCRFSAGNPHVRSGCSNAQTQLRSGPLLQHVTVGRSGAFGLICESQHHQLHARQPLLPLRQLHHCRLAMRKGKIVHGSSRDSPSRAATMNPDQQDLPEDGCRGHCLDDADPLAMYCPEDLVYFPREVAGEVECGTATCPGTTGSAAHGPANCNAWEPSIELTQSNMVSTEAGGHCVAGSGWELRPGSLSFSIRWSLIVMYIVLCVHRIAGRLGGEGSFRSATADSAAVQPQQSAAVESLAGGFSHLGLSITNSQ